MARYEIIFLGTTPFLPREKGKQLGWQGRQIYIIHVWADTGAKT